MTENNVPPKVYLDWFHVGKQLPKYVYKTHTGKLRQMKDDNSSECSYSTRASTRTDYARHYQLVEERRLLFNEHEEIPQYLPSLEACETLTSTGGITSIQENPSQFYSKYNFSRSVSSSLIIDSYKTEIVDRIKSFPTVVIQGCTGCGKTTRIPQFILDSHVTQGKYCNIIVTQPRRIAAMSVAKRVAEERNWTLGDLVGYQVGLKAVTNANTRMTFVTTGVLLQKLINARSLDDYTHIIIDEVHERNQEIDFLMIVVRKLMRTVSKSTKVIIMSATLDAYIYAEYFSNLINGRVVIANVLEIKENSPYEVYEFYLDHCSSLGPLPQLDWLEASFPVESVHFASKLIEYFDEMEAPSKRVNEEFPENRGSVLVFLPGIEEINLVFYHLSKKQTSKKWWILPLHSSITLQEQSRVFKQPEKYQRKIILSTNIAESSLTVPDIVYIIDYCLTRNLMCDPVTNYTGLQLCWASKANCTQRKGRAGRVGFGRVYRMVFKKLYDEYFCDYCIPEMKRCLLSKCVLQAKLLNMGEPKAILGLAIDPPDLSGLEQTIIELLEIGALALKRNENGVINSHDGHLTFMGKVISKLPLNPHLGKLILLGHAFNCLEDCIIIAAGMSLKNIFSRPYGEILKSYESKFAWANHSFSDCIAIRNVFKDWCKKKDENFFVGPGTISERKWADNNLIQLRRLNDVYTLVTDLKQRLEHFNVKIPNHTTMSCSVIEKDLILKLIIAGAFYPRYYGHQTFDEEILSRELCGYDSTRTVIVSGLPVGQAHLYGFAIENLFEEPCKSSLKIHFDKGSSKSYVEFLHNEKRSTNYHYNEKITTPAMYLAIKMRSLRMPLEIKLLAPNEVNRFLEKVSREIENGESRSITKNRVLTYSHSILKQVSLPPQDATVIPFRVTEIIDCGHFYVNYNDHDSNEDEKKIRHLIRRSIEGHNKAPPDSIIPGVICLAPLKRLGKERYVRARVEFITGSQVGIFYIDYGGRTTVTRNDLREINLNEFFQLSIMPMRAIECKLSCIRPSNARNPSGSWSKEGTEFFSTKTMQKDLMGRIYSIVHNIIRMEVMYKNKQNQEVSLNEKLKEKQFADEADEDSYSKRDNRLRYSEESLNYSYLENDEPVDLSCVLSSTELEGLTMSGRKLKLKGPYSPLELTFRGITNDDQSLCVRVDQESVNSVAFCFEPQNRYSRILVAGEVNVTQSRNTIIVRNTTLLPDIRGLLSLICMVFAPQVEFRTNEKRSCYTGIVCGLGYDPVDEKPIYINHDMEVAFETLITKDDVYLVNNVRMGINLILGEDKLDWDLEGLKRTQTFLQNNLLKLILKKREPVEPFHYPFRFKWNQIDPRYLLTCENESTIESSMTVLPLLNGVALVEESKVDKLKENIRELHKMLQANLLVVYTRCQVCNVEITKHSELRDHLDDPNHRVLESKLWDDK